MSFDNSSEHDSISPNFSRYFFFLRVRSFVGWFRSFPCSISPIFYSSIYSHDFQLRLPLYALLFCVRSGWVCVRLASSHKKIVSTFFGRCCLHMEFAFFLFLLLLLLLLLSCVQFVLEKTINLISKFIWFYLFSTSISQPCAAKTHSPSKILREIPSLSRHKRFPYDEPTLLLQHEKKPLLKFPTSTSGEMCPCWFAGFSLECISILDFRSVGVAHTCPTECFAHHECIHDACRMLQLRANHK